MPFDSADLSPTFAPRRRPGRGLTLGVFSYEGQWKVYSEFSRASLHPDRRLALIAAEDLAQETIRAGGRVELYVEDEDGALSQAPLDADREPLL